MAQAELYVDPSIAADSGAGTIGDPYGDLEYCLEQEDWDAVNGIRVNIKAGTDEVVVAELATAMADVAAPGKTVAWTPTETVPLTFQGYTSAAGDGGFAGISGGGSVSIYNNAVHDNVNFVDLHLHNCGAANIILADDACSFVNCELDNTTGSALVLGINGNVISCYIHNIGTFGISANGGRSGFFAFNVFENGVNAFTTALQQAQGSVYRNIINISGASNGLTLQDGMSVIQNSIYSNGGSGFGIGIIPGVSNAVILNNLIEGFSGSGGQGLDLDGELISAYGGNSVYNCETDFAITADIMVNLGGNESLAASPFTDAATGDFSPVDTGLVKEGSVPANFANGLA